MWRRDGVEVNRTDGVSGATGVDMMVYYADQYTTGILNDTDIDAVYWCEMIINTQPPINVTRNYILDSISSK